MSTKMSRKEFVRPAGGVNQVTQMTVVDFFSALRQRCVRCQIADLLYVVFLAAKG